MATPQIIRVEYDIDTQEVRDNVKAWRQVAHEIGITEQEAEELGQTYQREMRKTSGEIRRTTKETENLGRSFKQLAKIATTAVAVKKVLDLGKAAVQAAADYETLETSFKTFLGSADAAKKVLGDLEKFSLKTPFTPDQVNEAARALLAFGEPADNLTTTLTQLGDISAGTGKNFGDLATLFGKARVAGVLMAEDINQFTEAGVPVIEEFAKILGVSTSEVKKLGSEGRITFPVLQDALRNMTSEGGKFGGLMSDLSSTTNGAISTLKGYGETARRAIGSIFLPLVKSAVTGANRLLGALFDTRSESERLFEEYRTGQQAFEQTEQRLTGLLAEYENLSGRTNLNTEEQERLHTVIDELSDAVPGVVTEFDAYGNALAINTSAVRLNIEQQRELLATQNADALKETRKEFERLAAIYGKLGQAAQSGGTAFLANELAQMDPTPTREWASSEKAAQDYYNLLAQEREKQAKIFKRTGLQIVNVARRAEELGYELTAADQAVIDRILSGTRVREKAAETTNAGTEKQIGLLARLRQELKALQKQQLEATSRDQTLELARQIAAKQKEINDLTKVGGKDRAKNTDDAAKAQKRLNAELKKMRDAAARIAANATQPGSIARMNADLQTLENRLSKLTVGSDEFNALQKEVKQATAAIEEATAAADLGLSVEKYREFLASVEEAANIEIPGPEIIVPEPKGPRGETLEEMLGNALNIAPENMVDFQRALGAVTDLYRQAFAAIDAAHSARLEERLGQIETSEAAALNALQREREDAAAVTAEQKAALQRRRSEQAEEQQIRDQFAAERERINQDFAKREQNRAKAIAIINGAVAFTKALSASPPPFNFIQAAAVAASVAGQVAVINAERFAKGGPVDGGIRGKDSVPALLMPGEFVMTVDNMRKHGELIRAIHADQIPRSMLMPKIANVAIPAPSQAANRRIDAMAKDIAEMKTLMRYWIKYQLENPQAEA